MQPTRQVVRGGVGLAAALAVLVQLAVPPAGGDAAFAGGAQRSALPRPAGVAMRATSPSKSTATQASLSAPTQREAPARPASIAMSIDVVSPQKLAVGEMGDLIVSVPPDAGAAEVSFTLQFDANVLQVRGGSEGDWAAVAGSTSRFSADVSDAGDRVQVRSARAFGSIQRATGRGGSVAVVQFQAVAPGSTSVLVSDVSARDLDGAALPFSLSASSLQVIAESLPEPAARDLQQGTAGASSATAVGGDAACAWSLLNGFQVRRVLREESHLNGAIGGVQVLAHASSRRAGRPRVGIARSAVVGVARQTVSLIPSSQMPSLRQTGQ